MRCIIEKRVDEVSNGALGRVSGSFGEVLIDCVDYVLVIDIETKTISGICGRRL